MSAAFAASSQIYFQGMAPDGPGRSVALRRFAPLILPRVLEETSRQGLTSNDIAQRDHAFSQFHDWREKLRRPQFANMTECQLEQAFNAQCLGALGYQSMDKVPAGNAYTLIPKPSLPNATPDVVLGRFASPSPQAITPQIRAVVELKGPRVKLDRPTGQNRTPVQQAFDYLGLIDGPELWAVVSNMHEFRLYAKSRSTTRALCFQLDELADPDTFAQFYTAFAAQNLLNDQATPYSTLGMLQRSEQKQQKVGKELYDHYRENRLKLISVIRSHPLCHSFEDALAAAQRLLDRILFIAFAEDRGLLNNRRRIEEAARTNTLGLTPWSLESPKVNQLLEKIRRNGVPLSEYAGCKPLYGIKTGYNEAFLIDIATRDRLVQEDARSAEIIKPYLRGQDIKRWVPEWAGLWMIFTRRGIDIDQYPAIKRHLEQYREGLEPKPPGYTGKDWPGRKAGSYKWYEIQDSIDYWREFEKPKIMYQVIQTHSQYCMDDTGLFGNDKTFMIPTDKQEVLATFNSPAFWYSAFATLPHMINEALNPACFVMESIPIPAFTGKTLQEVHTRTELIKEFVKKRIRAQKTIIDWLKIEINLDKPSQKLLECYKLTSR